MASSSARLPSAARSLLALGVLCLAPAFRSPAAEQPKLAVLEFEVAKGLQIDRIYFSDKVRSLARKLAPQAFVMTRESTEMLLKASGTSLEKCLTEGICETDIAKRLGADYVVSGRLTRPGSRILLTMRLHATATGELLGSEEAKGKDVDELIDSADAAVRALLAPLAPLAGRGGAPAARAAPAEAKIDEQGAQVDLGAGGDEVLVKVESEPAGAVALVDGRLLCQSTPCSKMVASGAHELTFQKEGYEGEAQRVQVKKGLTVSGRLLRIAATLSVETEPAGLPVSIDGEKVGTGPISRRELAPGAHEVVVEDACWLKTGERVVLKKGEDRTLRLVGKPRVAGLKLSAEDDKGNAVEARAKLDGKPLGPVPGSFTVSVCSKQLVVEGEGAGAEQTLSLQEGKVAQLALKLAQLGPVRGKGSTDRRTGLEYIGLPGGALVGGNFPGERVAPFSLGKTATTVAAYGRCVAAGACTEPKTGGACNWKVGRENHPVNCVDWSQAQAFCKWIGGRLPTSQEREWAASGGEGREYPWGSQAPGGQLCWDGEGSDQGKGNRKTTCPVGSYPAGDSKHGLKDMAGNVWEWTSTDYDSSSKELRGASWDNDYPANFRAADRLMRFPFDRFVYGGFRCAL